MRGTTRRTHAALLGVLFVISGCSASVASTAPATPTPSPSPAASTASSSAPPSSAVAVSPRPTNEATPQASARTLAADSVAVTEVGALRVRSKPRVAEDSYKHEPLLPLGTPLYILDGPVSASGYTWYEVDPLGSRTLPPGWVAAASRTGETWLAPGDFDCPPVPTDFRTLAALPSAVGLACFPRTPINVVARLISCECDVDGAWLTPGWFSSGTGRGQMLVEPGMTRPPTDVGDWFWLSLDPAGQHPRDLPLGDVVEVSGVFDHPDAAGLHPDSARWRAREITALSAHLRGREARPAAIGFVPRGHVRP